MRPDIVAQHTNRISELEEEVRQLREAVVPSGSEYPHELGLTRCQVALFKRLSKTKIVHHQDLLFVLEQTTGRPSCQNILRTQISKMRARLAKAESPYEIMLVWGVGYRLAKRGSQS